LKVRQIDFPHPHKQSWFLITHKDAEISIPDLKAIFYPLELKYELESLKRRLEALESHPYVKLGKKVNSWLRWLKRTYFKKVEGLEPTRVTGDSMKALMLNSSKGTRSRFLSFLTKAKQAVHVTNKPVLGYVLDMFHRLEWTCLRLKGKVGATLRRRVEFP